MSALFGAIWRSRRAGLLRLRKADRPTRLDCIGGQCGLCCQVTGGDVIVTAREEAGLPPGATERRGKVIVLKSTGGSCDQLVDRACRCYGARPSGCHEYPWYAIGGQLYVDSGCPGVHHRSDGRPPLSSLSPIEGFLPTSRWLRHCLVLLFRLW